jgi:hypothetical protein
MKKFIKWLFKKVCLSQDGIHVITCINLRCCTSQERARGQQAVKRYMTVCEAARDQLTAELEDITGGEWGQQEE